MQVAKAKLTLEHFLVISTFLSTLRAHAIDSQASSSRPQPTSSGQLEQARANSATLKLVEFRHRPQEPYEPASSLGVPSLRQLTLTPLRASELSAQRQQLVPTRPTSSQQPQQSTTAIPSPALTATLASSSSTQNQISATTSIGDGDDDDDHDHNHNHNHEQTEPSANTWLDAIQIGSSAQSTSTSASASTSALEQHESASDNDWNSEYLHPYQTEAATDSEEDLLDANTSAVDSLNSNSNSNLNTTQYTLGASQPSLPAPSLDDEEQRLLETNNVSAILAQHPRLDHRSRPGHEAQANLSTLIQQAANQRDPLTCHQAHQECTSRQETCKPALQDYKKHCHALIHNKTQTCSPMCLNALIALRSSEHGYDFINCDCQDDEFCLKSRQRSQICKPLVDEAVDDKTIVSCSTASLICLADISCYTALNFYSNKCKSLFSLRYCSRECNNSLTILHQRPQAKKLINCYCDGDKNQESQCNRYKTYTERYCLHRQTSVDNINEDANQQVAMASDDAELSNMTHDPEDSNSHENFDVDRDEHWIPLMSGSYFENRSKLSSKSEQQQHLNKSQRITKQKSRSTNRLQSHTWTDSFAYGFYKSSAGSKISSDLLLTLLVICMTTLVWIDYFTQFDKILTRLE